MSPVAPLGDPHGVIEGERDKEGQERIDRKEMGLLDRQDSQRAER
jgi:hypothetical protein